MIGIARLTLIHSSLAEEQDKVPVEASTIQIERRRARRIASSPRGQGVTA